jgi:hypothetical protein
MTWQELSPLESYLTTGDDVMLLSPRAYQYYLPAYLMALLDKSGDENYLEGVLDSLWPTDSARWPHRQELWEKRVARLSRQQKTCVARILLHIQTRMADKFVGRSSKFERIETMLLCYWNAYL